MPKIISNKELESIVAIVASHHHGITIDVIRKALSISISDRMLQRRLKMLSDEKRIISKGIGRGKVYFPIEVLNLATVNKATDTLGSINLSTEGEVLKELILRPISERTPIGYHSGFLASYEPNTTEYIPPVIQRELAGMGQVGQTALPPGTYLRQIMDRLIIDLSWNSSRLEGNTYSLLDTQILLEQGESTDGKTAEDTQMILNHKAAIDMLAEQSSDIKFNRYTICNLHAVLSENLLPDSAAGGLLRTRLIGITGTVYEPLQVPQKIEQSFDQILEKASAIINPFEQAFFVMVHLPYLQPFEDVNKRVSRLAANIPLIRHNLCPLSFVDVNQEDYARSTLCVYEQNRIEYLRDVFVWAYQRSCARYSAIRQSLGKPDPFRLRYRQQISRFVCKVVQEKMDKRIASKWIDTQASMAISATDNSRFVEVVESELSNMHEGNIARYRLRPSEFDSWKSIW